MDNYSADRPILSTDDDAFGRSDFARQIAKGIVNIPAANGFVLGLSGTWGSGKSSTIEMILEWINFQEISDLSDAGTIRNSAIKIENEADLYSLSATYRKKFLYLDKFYADETKSAQRTAYWHLINQIKASNDSTAFSNDEILHYFYLKQQVKKKTSYDNL